jgi:glycosyltransferase involved in cell wall biosynthesis
MKIAFVAPGEIEIPPKNWGALENVVHSLATELKKLGEDVLIINEKDIDLTYEKIKAFNPDVLHIHYGKHYELMPRFDCQKIVTSYDGTFEQSFKFHDWITRKYLYDCKFVLLREFEKTFFFKMGISPKKLKILPLGVFTSHFKQELSAPKRSNKSIYLGKIDARKRQYIFQNKGLSIDFVGPNASDQFDETDPCYLGVWTEKEKHETLTEYGNLVLLSVSENGNPPLVCLEAMAAGLGIVISEASNEGVDNTKDFITVIPEDKMLDADYLKKAIQDNREYSINNRAEIIDYAQNRDWSNVAKIYKEYL